MTIPFVDATQNTYVARPDQTTIFHVFTAAAAYQKRLVYVQSMYVRLVCVPATDRCSNGFCKVHLRIRTFNLWASLPYNVFFFFFFHFPFRFTFDPDLAWLVVISIISKLKKRKSMWESHTIVFFCNLCNFVPVFAKNGTRKRGRGLCVGKEALLTVLLNEEVKSLDYILWQLTEIITK